MPHVALWPFMAALLILIIYVVVYLATITQRKHRWSATEAGDDALASSQADPGNPGSDWTPGSSLSSGPTDLAAD